MIEIDGSEGEGGGQIIRSSLALSAITGRPVRITKIRAGRKSGGLKRQHVTAVNAIATICDAEVSGAEIGSSTLAFHPKSIRAGDYSFAIGTAGSTSLVAQTILPALCVTDKPSTITLDGGTHNPFCPPFDFLERSYLPQLAKTGPKVTANLEKHGFFPAGGGRIRLEVQPSSSLRGLELMQIEGPIIPTVTAIVSSLPRSIAEREIDVIRRGTNWPKSNVQGESFRIHEVADPAGPGNVVIIDLVSSTVTDVLIAIGEVGRPSERVAKEALRAARSYIKNQVPVGVYLADQLILPLSLATAQGNASCFRTVRLSQHSQTHIDIVKRFLDLSINCQIDDGGSVTLRFE